MLTGENFRGKPVDIWACGVTLYMFVYGHPPFEAKTMTELYDRIQVSLPHLLYGWRWESILCGTLT